MDSSIIGHGHVLRYLSDSIARTHISHAYLFVGPRHCGKTTVARWFCDMLVPTERIMVPPDEEERSVTIEDIRDVIASSSRTTFDGGYRIVCIPHADFATIQASNALLKALEEPPEKTIFILCTVQEHAVLPTIRSRCTLVRFASVPSSIMRAGLKARQCSEEKSIEYADASAGLPGLALRLMNDSDYRNAWHATTAALYSFEDAPLWSRATSLAISDPEALLECIEHYLHMRTREHLRSETPLDFLSTLMNRVIALRSTPVLLSSKGLTDRLFIAP